jgi:hypothetical protein
MPDSYVAADQGSALTWISIGRVLPWFCGVGPEFQIWRSAYTALSHPPL